MTGRRNSFHPGDLVRFKDDYDGYFRDFRFRDLTVAETFPADEGTDCPTVKIREIMDEDEAQHLIREDHLVAAR